MAGASDIDPATDLILLLTACSAALDDTVLRRVRDEVGDDIRFHDGYVFQHLVPGPCSVSELARRLGVSQQAASKQLADLSARKLVLRRRDPDDSRAWRISLSARGRRAVEAGRAARAAAISEVEDALGPATTRDLVDALGRLSDHLGALDQLMQRRLRPEQSR